MKDEILNIVDLSHYLKCSVSTVRNLVRKNKLPYFRIGAKIYFRLSQIERWIVENESK